MLLVGASIVEGLTQLVEAWWWLSLIDGGGQGI